MLSEIKSLRKTRSSIVNFTPSSVLTAMFGIDHKTMSSSESEGRLLIREMDIVLKEFSLKQVFNPFRFLMFWHPEIKRAKAAAIVLEDSQKKLLSDYRLKKSPEEFAKDPSILGHIARNLYASDKENART